MKLLVRWDLHPVSNFNFIISIPTGSTSRQFHSHLTRSYPRVNVISIVETILALPSPSLDGISSVPMMILPIFNFFMNLRLVIHLENVFTHLSLTV